MPRKLSANDDPLLESAVPKPHGLSPIDRTDRIPRLDDDLEVVASGAESSGQIEYDERGHARWKWVTEIAQNAPADQTFDQLKALTNNRLRLLDESQVSRDEPAAPPPGGGYNPYETTPKAPQRPLKPRPK
jgi:hypothetical protein